MKDTSTMSPVADPDVDTEKQITRPEDPLPKTRKEEIVTTDPDINSKDIVSWDGPNDPANPMNWSKRRKWTAISIMSMITFITPFASSMLAPGVPQLMAEFGSDNTALASFVISVYLLGYVAGPFLVAPMSELYGRAIVIHVTNILFIIFTIISAVSNSLGMLIFFRFAMGFCGACPLTVGGGVVADLMEVEERGLAVSIWIMGSVLGPATGPAIAGYLVEAKGWRWTFWLLAMMAGISTIICFVFYHETYAPTLLSRKTARLRKETNNPNLRSSLDHGESAFQLFAKALYRPPKLLVLSPIVFFMSLDVAIAYGYLYLLFSTFTYVFEATYGFTSGEAGLTYLGFGTGNLLGLFIYSHASDRIVKSKSAISGVYKPEYRLPPLIPGAIILPIGLFWYGWAAQAEVHWMVPITGMGVFGVGMIFTWMSIQSYVVDAFPLYAASASAALAALRSLFGAMLPLAGQSMYDRLGLGWGNSVLAFIAVALIPIPFIFMRYGERIRTNPRFQLDL